MKRGLQLSQSPHKPGAAFHPKELELELPIGSCKPGQAINTAAGFQAQRGGRTPTLRRSRMGRGFQSAHLRHRVLSEPDLLDSQIHSLILSPSLYLCLLNLSLCLSLSFCVSVSVSLISLCLPHSFSLSLPYILLSMVFRIPRKEGLLLFCFSQLFILKFLDLHNRAKNTILKTGYILSHFSIIDM